MTITRAVGIAGIGFLGAVALSAHGASTRICP